MEVGLGTTPSQTVGPFFRLGVDELAVDDVSRGDNGLCITIEGTVFDGAGEPVTDALIETWQADVDGVYPRVQSAGEFRGFGRVATDDNGHFRLRTVKPGLVPAPNGSMQAPHLVIAIFMRGLLKHLVTRIYFEYDAANETDLILNLVEPSRRRTLMATRQPGTGDVYTWDVHLQGQDETAFFDV
jgi:protocatechuate 3,4-dioxygenase, alpha subunit